MAGVMAAVAMAIQHLLLGSSVSQRSPVASQSHRRNIVMRGNSSNRINAINGVSCSRRNDNIHSQP